MNEQPTTTCSPADALAAAVEPRRVAALRARPFLNGESDESFDRLSRLACRLIDAPVALISLVESDRQVFKSCVGLPDPWASWRETPLSHSFCKHVVASREPLIVIDARQDPVLRRNPAVDELGVVAYLGVPLFASDPGAEALGSFCVTDRVPRTWTTADVDDLQTLATSVMAEFKWRHLAHREQLLLQELKHRARNNFNTLASLVDLTARHQSDCRAFAGSLRRRIVSMSAIHDLLSGDVTEPVDLHALVHAVSSDEQRRRVRLDGPHVRIASSHAASLGMVLTELLMNASKYGALRTVSKSTASEEGHVDVSWRLRDGSGVLDLAWTEALPSADRPLQEPTRRGSGSVIIEQLIGYEFEGDVSFDFTGDGLVARLSLRRGVLGG